MTCLRLALTFAALLPIAACAPLDPRSNEPASTALPMHSAVAHSTAPKLLLISIDGLRADALDRGITPNLQRIIDEGVRARWMTPSYPSLTFPNHYTIVTGLRPDHHGIIHNTMVDAELGTFKLSDRDAVSTSAWWGGEPIWVAAEKAGVRTATWSWPGSEAPIQGIQPSQWRRYDTNVPFEDRVQTVLGWLQQTDADAPRLVTLYLENVDHAGHEHGPDSPEYAAAIKRADQVVGEVLDGLQQRGLADSTNIIVVSDHGMAPATASQAIAIEDMVSPDLARSIGAGQSVGFQPQPGREDAAGRALIGRHAHYECWKKEMLPARWHYGSNPRIPPIVCQMDESWNAYSRALIAKHGSKNGGSHGYDNALPSMRAVFIARGPSFRQGQVIDGFDNVDVYPLLGRLLQVPVAPNDGDATTLLDALR